MDIIQKLLLSIALVSGFTGNQIHLANENSQNLTQRQEVIKEVSQIEVKQNTKEKELDKLIDKLAFCESGNNNLAIHYNDGDIGSHSYGLFQFKKETFFQEVKRYKMLDENNLIEWENWIYDGEFQKQLVYKMLSDKKENWRHWTNCSKRIHLVEKK